jgi:hypothetical protein
MPEEKKGTDSIVTHCVRKPFLGFEIRLIIFAFSWVSQHHLAVREGGVLEQLVLREESGK